MATAPQLTMRRRLLLDGVASGMSISDAGKGLYADRKAAHEAFQESRDRILETMDAVGLSEWEICARVRELADADKVTVVSRPEGIARIDVPDNGVRVKAVEIAAKMRGITERNDGPRIGTVNILWAGHAPAWAKPIPSGADAEIVHTDNQMVTEPNGVPISTVEGTGAGPAPSTHTHPVKSASESVLTQRVTKKRGPRLPVLGGRAKP